MPEHALHPGHFLAHSRDRVTDPLVLSLEHQRREGPARGVGLLLERIERSVAPEVLLPRNPPEQRAPRLGIAGLARVHQLMHIDLKRADRHAVDRVAGSIGARCVVGRAEVHHVMRCGVDAEGERVHQITRQRHHRDRIDQAERPAGDEGPGATLDVDSAVRWWRDRRRWPGRRRSPATRCRPTRCCRSMPGGLPRCASTATTASKPRANAPPPCGGSTRARVGGIVQHHSWAPAGID